MPNGMNQYTSVGNQAIAYDDHFNVRSYNGATFTYDAESRLVGGTMQATYDGLGRCVRRVTTSGTRLYTYDGWKPILEWNGNGSWQAWNIYGAGPDEILARNDATYGATLYKQDKQGNVVALLNANGNVLEKYFYDAFGYPTVTDYSGNERGHASSCGNRFLFTGREWIASLGIYDYRHRMYHPGLGRFLQTDPMGLQTEGEKLSAGQKALFTPGGSAPEAFSSSEMNLFRYCGDDPVDRSDPTGLYWDIRGSQAFVDKVLSQLWGAAQQDKNVANAIAEIRDSSTGHIVQQAQDPRNPAPTTSNGLKGNATREFWGNPKAIFHNAFSSGSRYTQTWYNPDNWSMKDHPDRPPVAGLIHEMGHILDLKRGTWTDLQRPHEAPVMEQRAIWWENQIRPHYNTPLRDINDW
jgi:RHS repeat-associated protein